MKYSEIINAIDNIFDFFKFHNKNLTKEQADKIEKLQNLIHEMRLTK